MGSPGKKKVRIVEDEEERISRLPDELIHKILSFLDTKEAVQTSVLSKRWKLIWTTLPFLNFGWYGNSLPKNNFDFIRHVLSNRNYRSNVFELSFCVYNKGLPVCLPDKLVEYAISHNVKYLNIDLSFNQKSYKLSTFSSNSLEKLRLRVKLEECALESDCWDLPALTSLHLVSPHYDISKGFSQSRLKDLWFRAGLPALRTLCLDNWDLSVSSFSFSLPDLTTLRLRFCILPETVWDFPALVNLDMDELTLPKNMNDILATLVNLQNLTLSLSRLSVMQREFFISCPPQLLNLTIRISTSYAFLPCCNIVVLAPKLCNFTSFGIFTATLEVPELENVNIRVQGWFRSIKCNNRKLYYRWLTTMLLGLGNAKNLTFDLESFEALNEILTFLKSLPSPFSNLNYVKLPRGYKESNISSALRNYLLSGSSGATIVTTLPQGHEVKSEFVGLLELIMEKYPETFEHFTTKSKSFCSMKLIILCTSITAFITTAMTEINSEMITEYMTLFSYLQSSFNLQWLVNHLYYIEQLLISQRELPEVESCIDDATNKLKLLPTLGTENMAKIEEAFGSTGTNLAASDAYIEDDP